jgi:hypothetical protein
MDEPSWTASALEAVLPALVVSLLLAGAFAAGITAMILKSREKERLHKERMLLVERGAEIPRELLGFEEKKPSDYRTTRVVLLITGAFFIVMSIGVVVGIGVQEGFREAAPGVISAAIGAGLLVAERMIGRRFGSRTNGKE